MLSVPAPDFGYKRGVRDRDMADYDNPLERYQIMDPLGHGGSGRTFRGIDRATGRDVAIKVLSLRMIDDWKRFDLFEREAAVLGTLEHPGIPRYIDHYASENSGDYFLVMELREGTPLSRRIAKQQRLPPKALRSVLDQGLAILEYLHGLSPPVIHRDIKPANLLLDARGHLSLVDFGGVRKVTATEGGTTMIGTFGYMAPEQLHGEAGPGTDLYALGATIAALHAGVEADKLPHDGLAIDLKAIDLPAALAPALERMLQPDPKQRARTVAEVRAVLDGRATPTAGSSPGRLPGAAAGPGTRADRRAPAEPSQSLVPIDDDIRDLARVPRPFSILVWLVSAIAAGGLTVFLVVMMPLILTVARAFTRKDPRRRAEVEADLQRMRQTVATTRRSLSHVAGQTNPMREDDEAAETDETRRKP